MFSMKTYKVATRDQFVIQLMPELVIVKITELATNLPRVLERCRPDA